MASTAGLRGWHQVHTWSSLACALFLLLLCVTGLPLVFKDEFEAGSAAPADAAADARRVDLDVLVAAARGPGGLFPSEVVRWISLEDDRAEVWIALAPAYDADRKLDHVLRFDALTGRVVAPRRAAAEAGARFISAMFWLHKGLLAGEVGELFLGAMGLLFLVATVSGVVLYAPFMRKLEFGTVRRHRGRRLRWLDLHNLLGIATVAWVLVVAVTGVLNEVSEPIYGRWRESAIRDLLKPYEGRPMPTQFASVQGAADAVSRALPGMKIRSVRYPDRELGSPHHYLVWAIGDSPLRSRLFQPALVDAATGELSTLGHVPWYLSAVQLARPLHFGDYGGMPMKILWTMLDLLTIAVLGSGVYLWIARGRAAARHR